MSFGNTWRKIGDMKLTCGWLDFKIYHMLGKTNTNATIENYHGTLKLGKSRLVGHHVD